MYFVDGGCGPICSKTRERAMVHIVGAIKTGKASLCVLRVRVLLVFNWLDGDLRFVVCVGVQLRVGHVFHQLFTRWFVVSCFSSSC